MTAAPPAQPLFLGSGANAAYTLYHAPAGTCRGAWVYLHPFAEEMNKSRRMAALGARALAAHGHAVLQIDLHGCGDSAGESGDADWTRWQDDVARASNWLAQRHGNPGLWGLRSGALLAVDAARQGVVAPAALLLWQPVLNGSVFLQQFLRLKVAAQMLGENESAGGGTAALRAALQAGESLEIAGYALSPALAASLDGLDMQKMAAPACPVHWLEVVAAPERPLPPASARVLANWGAHGVAVAGPQFWASQEIAECPALVDATVAAVCQEARHAA